jgi:hypothetical protein
MALGELENEPPLGRRLLRERLRPR